MEEASLHISKTHDLEALLNALLPAEPLWASLRPALQDLTDFAVDFRYPVNQAAKRGCKAGRTEARVALGLPV